VRQHKVAARGASVASFSATAADPGSFSRPSTGAWGVSGTTIVSPYGTELVDDDPLTIEIPDYGTFALGDDVKVGGGYVLEHSSTTREPGP
jgi:hypothetical protein